MSSWFYKLRRKRSCDANAGATTGFAASIKPAARQNHKPPPPSPVTPCSPNRASYYFPSGSRNRERAGLSPKQQYNPKLREARFPRSPQLGDIVFDVVPRRDHRFGFGGADEAMHGLKLRPIITRAHGDDAEASDSSSVAASPTATTTRRMMRRRLHASRAPPSVRRKKTVTGTPAEKTGRLRWVYESVVVVKESAQPEEDFLASMRDMIAANDVRSPRGLHELLACYLALNAADHHHAIVAAFRRAWLDLLDRAPPPLRECCRLHARCAI